MNRETEILKVIVEQGVLPLYFHEDPDTSIRFLEALHAAGVQAVEYANRGESALRNFEKMRQYCDSDLPDLYLGIGTIKRDEEAHRYVDAGSDFLVCPGLVEGAAAAAKSVSIPWIPGCMTPTEIIRAEVLGAKMVKLYPLNTLGPAYYGAITAVFPDLLFMPTGGIEVDDETVKDWINAGIGSLGGSKLLTPEILREEQYDLLIKDTSHVLELIRTLRSTTSRFTTQELIDRLHRLSTGVA